MNIFDIPDPGPMPSRPEEPETGTGKTEEERAEQLSRFKTYIQDRMAYNAWIVNNRKFQIAKAAQKIQRRIEMQQEGDEDPVLVMLICLAAHTLDKEPENVISMLRLL